MDLLSTLAYVVLDIGPKPPAPTELSGILQLPYVNGGIWSLVLFGILPLLMLSYVIYYTWNGQEQKKWRAPGYAITLLGLVVFALRLPHFYDVIHYYFVWSIGLISVLLDCAYALFSPVLISVFLLFEVQAGKERESKGLRRFIVPLMTFVAGILNFLAAWFFLSVDSHWAIYYMYHNAEPLMQALGVLYAVCGAVLMLSSIYVLYKRLKR